MSEDDKQPPKPPKPMKKTSDVPLKKETVRVTLKATDDSQKAAPAPSAPQPPAPAPTIPLRAANLSAPSPKVAAPAPTVQLKTPGAATAPKTTPLKTQPLSTPGDGGTQALPKATVQLGSATQALGAPTALSATAAQIQTAVEDEDEGTDTVAGYLSLVAFLFALAVLGLQLSTAGKWVDEAEPVNGAGWNALFE
jgi:hypothetical protein